MMMAASALLSRGFLVHQLNKNSFHQQLSSPQGPLRALAKNIASALSELPQDAVFADDAKVQQPRLRTS